MGATAMLDFRLSKVPCKPEGRSDGKEGHSGGSGQEGQMGDDKTEERDDEGVVRKSRG
jgi:hypothetical protein